jgi:hypothetical protein
MIGKESSVKLDCVDDKRNMNDMTNQVDQVHSERGAVLLGVLMIVVILTLLGMVSMNLAVQEILQISSNKDEAAARQVAEAGSDVIIRWFHNINSTPIGASTILPKRFDLSDSGPSFFDSSGRSQFSGSNAAPDLLYDATRPGDDHLLNDPVDGLFRSLHSLGRIQTLKVYGPTRPGLLCSVEVTANAKHHTRTVTLQLGALITPPLRVGVQVGNSGVALTSDAAVPVWVHWGDLKAKGNVQLGRREDVPAKAELAPITGQSYADMASNEDRWLSIWTGGDALFTPSSVGSIMLPSNVYPRRDPFPGLHQDVWPYELLKKHAIQHGSYYTRDTTGLLYRNGAIGSGLGLTIEEAFRSQLVGHNRGLVFIDTLDRLPPRPDNLGTVVIDTDYAEGLFVVNAHVQLKPGGAGKSVSVLSPPNDGSSSFAARAPVTLSDINLNGVLATPGDLVYEGQPRVFGALLIEGRIVSTASTPTPIEVWYDYDFRSGLFRGLPVVYVAPGTWQEKY